MGVLGAAFLTEVFGNGFCLRHAYSFCQLFERCFADAFHALERLEQLVACGRTDARNLVQGAMKGVF